jgi:hypothetical protein
MLAGHDAEYIRLVWIVASAIGLGVLLTLLVLYRAASRRAEIEHADRVIAEHDET